MDQARCNVPCGFSRFQDFLCLFPTTISPTSPSEMVLWCLQDGRIQIWSEKKQQYVDRGVFSDIKILKDLDAFDIATVLGNGEIAKSTLTFAELDKEVLYFSVVLRFFLPYPPWQSWVKKA